MKTIDLSTVEFLVKRWTNEDDSIHDVCIDHDALVGIISFLSGEDNLRAEQILRKWKFEKICMGG